MDKEVRAMKKLVILQDILIRNVIEKLDVDDVSNTNLDDLLVSLYDYAINIGSYLSKSHLSISSSFDKAYTDILLDEEPNQIKEHYTNLTKLLESEDFKRLCK